MAGLLVVLIIAACVAYLLLKSTLVKSFTVLITAISAIIIAFAFFELLSNVFIGRNILVLWAQSLSFTLLFVLAFAVLQTITAQLTRQRFELGLLLERIGRVVCGIFLGLILSGLFLTVFAMAPMPIKYPYQRFDQANPNIEKPDKVLLNADGFVTGCFGIISSGSFSGKRSFATLHPAFLDQVFLNRHQFAENVSIITIPEAIKIPKKAVWPALDDIKDLDGRPIPSKSGHNLNIIRVGFSIKMLKKSPTFTLSQLRLICKQKEDAKKPLAGKGINIYPIGYLRTATQLLTKRLSDQIELKGADFKSGLCEIDFAFYVPNGFIPVLVEFKQNSIDNVPTPVTPEQAPPPLIFIPVSECTITNAKVQPVGSAKIHGLELTGGSELLTGLTLLVADANQWQTIQTDKSIKPPEFQDETFNYVRAELKVEKPAEQQAQDKDKKSWQQRRAFLEMFKPLSGYKLLSLKCNNPSAGVGITAEQLPTLIEASGSVHHAVGIIAAAPINEQTTIYEVDYCSLTTEEIEQGLTIAEDGSIAKPFPDNVWLPQEVQTISEFYVLYLVKAGQNAIISSVKPADTQLTADFEEHAGFLIK
ncbi:MAG: hypothetical protein JSV82_02775 [Planctomycetota bacterium]|nr:MAG: hypothetical protein JSV82_02775 [Planctomycetota bacterium]